MLDNSFNGKYNKLAGTGSNIKLYEQKVYSITPDLNGVFADENKRIIARRQIINLTVDSVYKTQFFNEKLKNAISPLTESTKIIYYDKNGEVNELHFLPTLSQDYSSIICKVQPKNELIAVSIVIYCGPEIEDILLDDGSIQMQDSYTPSKPKDIVTKDYADDLIEDFTSASTPLKSFSVKQGEKLPIKAYSYIDNNLYDVLFVRKIITKERLDDCKLIIDPFIINNSFVIEDTRIGIFIDGTINNIVYIKDILEGNTEKWSLISSENVYANSVNKIYWKNSYQFIFNLKDYESKINANYPFVDIAIKVWDDKNTDISNKLIFGLDEYITKVEPEDVNISYKEELFKAYKTKFISGADYFPEKEQTYSLPVEISVKNNFLQYFRNDTNIKLLVLDENKNTNRSYNLLISTHTPTSGTFTFNQNIEFNIKDKYLALQTTNLLGEILYTYYQVLETDTDHSDESNRVTTCSSEQITPATDYGEPWDSTKELNEWDLKLRNGVYEAQEGTKNSAVCFVVNSEECYSHININIEHDGQMYILSEGNTNWLNCQSLAKPFDIPKENLDGCKVNENYYTFGKVNYNSKVFIRIINATKVIFNSAELG